MRHLRHLSWLITLPLALLVVSFAVTNRATVPLGLWPLPFTVELPAFALVLVTFVLGFVIGGAIAWFGQHGHRKAERRHQSRADKLAHELEQTKARAIAAEKRLADLTAPATAAAALPSAAPVAATPNALAASPTAVVARA